MTFSATRLTCFALLSAIEEDLRFEIETQVEERDAGEFFNSDRLTKIQLRRARDHGAHPSSSIGSLLPYFDFADSYEILLREKGHLPSDLEAQLSNLGSRLVRLAAIRNRVAHTRPMEIDDLPSVLDLAQDLLAQSGSRWPTLRETMSRLTAEPAHVLGLTVNLPADPDTAPQHNLPVPDFDETGFFGRKQELARIKKAISGPYPVVSILGDGGIGKTSIALKAAYEFLDDRRAGFDAVVWVSAKATILTVNEIQHIGDAIQDSLGLFAAAAEELGVVLTQDTDPIREVLDYLENFKILLILDNLETVLDARLRSFLLELPLGSKVLITSRVGLGIENPINLEPLSDDDSARLIRALGRIRNVSVIQTMDEAAINRLVSKLNGHPAYIRWLVAGVQAGRRPSDLVRNNTLLLDFCMSNVYERLGEGARQVLRSMQVFPGARSQAEWAYINNISAIAVQAALLDLMTTNFVSMRSQSNAQALDTTYQISEFAKQYLDKQRPVDAKERQWLVARSQKLHELGAGLRAAGTSDPYSAETVDIRGTADFHVARLLRDAIKAGNSGQIADALEFCREAQLLSPSYHEAWRVEAYIQALRPDVSAALAAYERALELAPDSSTLMYFFGKYLLEDGGDPINGLRLLQASALTDPDEMAVLLEIVRAHLILRDYRTCLEAASHMFNVGFAHLPTASQAAVLGMRAANHGAKEAQAGGNLYLSVEYVEAGLELSEAAPVESLPGESCDRLLELASLARQLSSDLDEDFALAKVKSFEGRLRDRIRAVDASLLERRIGVISTIIWDRYFAFVKHGGKSYFFHYRDLADESDWYRLGEQSILAFLPDLRNVRGPRAVEPRLLQ
ncbi:NB-ARC domain-containing protein [Micromonospora sp. C28SCA-DRY-2]|uniref:NB-ARC domain-containing protein n=1 Tax=Micromonospora sp. C28SCA-DRY-2 TaxID=3059522 RepID=UPI002675B13C|nr:NB-ARC domain-containing protein [Micromonospora sp. C28SCA-DRY-2]MDO3700970.1 NB-ARC domain-containing protein [Micromonospora sp. C28SCA-DRY-2]